MSLCILAQAPEYINYQAVVRDETGNPVTSQGVSLRFSIYRESASGTLVYQEKHITTTNIFGLVTLSIGNGTDKNGDLASIEWNADIYFLKVEIDPAGGDTFTDMGTTQLISVPYALHAKSAATAEDAVKLTGDQIIEGNKTFTGTTTVADPVNDSDPATKAYVDALEEKVSELQAMVGVNDIDGNHYEAVKLGSQVWMAENLKTTKFNDGTAIPLVEDNGTWSLMDSPAYCWYNNDEGSNKEIHGALYNWFAASTGNICPVGWHVPEDSEWDILVNYLIANGYNYDGTTTGNKIAKALASDSGWTSSVVEGAVGNTDYPEKRNITGFTAQGSGYRYYSSGLFYNLNNHNIIWSATDSELYEGTMAFKRLLRYDQPDVNWSLTEKIGGCSIRCLKD